MMYVLVKWIILPGVVLLILGIWFGAITSDVWKKPKD
jgi:hypothetical protein